MEEILSNKMEAVPNVNVDIGHLTFDLAYPNIIMWLIVIVLVLALFYFRLPSMFKPKNNE